MAHFSPVGLAVKILKTLLPYSILAKCSAHLNFLDLITLTTLDEPMSVSNNVELQNYMFLKH